MKNNLEPRAKIGDVVIVNTPQGIIFKESSLGACFTDKDGTDDLGLRYSEQERYEIIRKGHPYKQVKIVRADQFVDHPDIHQSAYNIVWEYMDENGFRYNDKDILKNLTTNISYE